MVAQHYKYALSNSDGYAELTFTALSQDTEYLVCVSAEAVIPFRPRLKLKNKEVSCVSLKTKVDLNRKDKQDQAVQVIIETDPELARSVDIQIEQTEKKNKILRSNSPNNRRNRG